MFQQYNKIAGVTFRNEGTNESRQSIISHLTRKGVLKAGTKLMAVREPSNPYDRNAVAVFAPDRRQIGYLPKTTSETVARLMDKGASCSITVQEVTGGDVDYVYGVNIFIEVS